jgi:DNA-binding response OmpR family regulator
MLKVDGFEVLKVIRSSSLERLPVIMLTGSNTEEEMNQASDLGCDGFLVKPLTLDTLVKAVIDIQRFSLFIAELHD